MRVALDPVGLAPVLLGALALFACEVRVTPSPEAPPAPGPAPAPVTVPAEAEIAFTEDFLAGDEASLARNLYIVFDGSGSMGRRPDRGCRGDQRFETKLEGAQWALQTFLEKVPEDIHLGFYLFDDDGEREVVALGGGNRIALLAAVESVRAGGGTPLSEAIVIATDELHKQYRRQLGYGEYRLVVVTDGKASSIPRAAEYAARHGVPIYAIGLCIDEEHPLRQYAVSYRAADSFEDLAQGLEETLAELEMYDPTEFTEVQLR